MTIDPDIEIIHSASVKALPLEPKKDGEVGLFDMLKWLWEQDDLEFDDE